jgi:hypothetical protein
MVEERADGDAVGDKLPESEEFQVRDLYAVGAFDCQEEIHRSRRKWTQILIPANRWMLNISQKPRF